MGLEIISLLKKKLGLTTQQLSEMSGVPVGTLNKILNGTTLDPKLETLKALAKVLGCSLDDFDDKKQTNKQKIIISIFEKLNDIGKNEAIKRVEELTYINKYIKNDEICAMVAEEKEDYLMPIAAHDDDLTEDEKSEMDRRIEEYMKNRK